MQSFDNRVEHREPALRSMHMHELVYMPTALNLPLSNHESRIKVLGRCRFVSLEWIDNMQ